MAQLKIGDITVTALSDGRMSFQTTNMFPETPESLWDAYRDRFPEAFNAQGFLINIGVFHLASGGEQVLVDTGLGPHGAAQGRPGPPELIDDMRRKHVSPDEIDSVFLTHLHGDHVGWNMTHDEDGSRPTFPNARYLLQKADWGHFTDEKFLDDGRRDAAQLTYLPLPDMGVLDLIEGETNIAPGLDAYPTPGHTPGHQSMLISSRGERALIIGDVVGSPMHISEPDHVYRPDVDKEMGRKSRHEALDLAEANGMTVIGSHMTRPGWGRLIRWEGRRYWQAI
ncbi:MAG: MBL fold metallo-hydrolase [Chloroflexi bacterium]|nr:MBL fold metallo-hydrolase [Chloroflexota bacterium]